MKYRKKEECFSCSLSDSEKKEFFKEYLETKKSFVEKCSFLKKIADQPEMRFYIDLSKEKISDNNQKSELFFENVLLCFGYSHFDFEKGLAGKDAKNMTKIGRIFNKYKLLDHLRKWKIYSNKVIENKNLLLCLSINPIDILTASYGRNWTSCVSPNSSSRNYRYLANNLMKSESFSAIAYLINEDDKEILNPYGRAFLQIFTSERNTCKEKDVYIGGPVFYTKYQKKNEILSDKDVLIGVDSSYGRFAAKKFLKKYIWDNYLSSLDVPKTKKYKCAGYYNNSLPHEVSINYFEIKEKNDSKPKKIDPVIELLQGKEVKSRNENVRELRAFMEADISYQTKQACYFFSYWCKSTKAKILFAQKYKNLLTNIRRKMKLSKNNDFIIKYVVEEIHKKHG